MEEEAVVVVDCLEMVSVLASAIVRWDAQCYDLVAVCFCPWPMSSESTHVRVLVPACMSRDKVCICVLISKGLQEQSITI